MTKEKASIEIYGRSGNIIANLRNVSLTGACLDWTQDDVPLQKGDLVRVTVVLKALNRRHNLSAEVVWREGKASGVNFIKSEEVLEKIMERN
jgi:hypothetical protein